MAKLERQLWGDFDRILSVIQQGILEGSMSATLEGTSDFLDTNARYSYMGGNRLSMTVTLFQSAGGPVQLSAITAGGSQAMFFKINTFGEEAFLDQLRELLDGRD